MNNSGDRNKFVVPNQLKSRILGKRHDAPWGAHLGVAWTMEKIQQKNTWTGIRADVENWITSCHSCNTRNLPTNPMKSELQPILAEAPWQTVVIDMLGPLPRTNCGNKWTLVMMNRFTKWPECMALRSVKATVVARAFLMIVTRNGIPLVVSSDHGAHFTSNGFKDLSNMIGMKQKLSTAYRLQTQALVEKVNRMLIQRL